jgi:hypothetical protein
MASHCNYHNRWLWAGISSGILAKKMFLLLIPW